MENTDNSPPKISKSIEYDASEDWTSSNAYFKSMPIPDVEFSTEMIEAIYLGEIQKLRDCGFVVLESNDDGQQIVYSAPKISERSSLYLKNSRSPKLSVTKGRCLFSKNSRERNFSPRSPSRRSRNLTPPKKLFRTSPDRKKLGSGRRKRSNNFRENPSRYMSDPEMEFPNKYGGVATWASSLRSPS